MPKARLTLADLPQFTASSSAADETGNTAISGRFNQLRGVRKGFAWLFVSGADSVMGKITILDDATLSAVFSTHATSKLTCDGQTFPYLSGYWNAATIAMVLAGPPAWNRLEFRPSDAIAYRNSVGWIVQWAGGAGDVPTEFERVGVKESGWDHEHRAL
jgi:hypothetical protein